VSTNLLMRVRLLSGPADPPTRRSFQQFRSLQPAAFDVLDLAPTVVRLLGTRVSVPLAGQVIPQVVAAS